jgi:flagellar assembly factor FliW
MANGVVETTEKSREINFVKPVLGFEESRIYSFQEYKPGSPFMWMISAGDERLRFIVINVFDFFPGYDLKLSNDDRELLGFDEKSALVFGLVSIPENPEEMTVNLAAPVVVNYKKMAGGQFVNLIDGYSLKEPLVKRGEANADSVKENGRKDNNKR